MENKSTCFEAKTAKRIKKNVAGSPHSAFADATGNICLLGAVACRAAEWPSTRARCIGWGQQEGGRFSRAINLTTGFDHLAALDDLPDDDGHDQRDYIVLDPEDFEEERFPPLSASDDDAPFQGKGENTCPVTSSSTAMARPPSRRLPAG